MFKEPSKLPQKRIIGHAIPLIDGNKAISQRPYRLPFHHKNTMEDLVQKLLRANMMRPSVSPYSCEEERWYLEIMCGL
jgi:hypothetical protein